MSDLICRLFGHKWLDFTNGNQTEPIKVSARDVGWAKMNSTPNPLLVTEKEIDKIIQDLLVAKYPNNPPNFEGNEIAKTKLIDLMMSGRLDELARLNKATDNFIRLRLNKRIAQLNTYRDKKGQ